MFSLHIYLYIYINTHICIHIHIETMQRPSPPWRHPGYAPVCGSYCKTKDNVTKSSTPNNFANIKTKVMKIYIAHLFMLSYHTKFERVCSKFVLFFFFPFDKQSSTDWVSWNTPLKIIKLFCSAVFCETVHITVKSKCWSFITEGDGSIDTLHYMLGV